MSRAALVSCVLGLALVLPLSVVGDEAEQASSTEKIPEGLGDYVSFPAIGIQLRQPEGFEKSDSFDGFGQEETSSSILIMRIPAPYSKIAGELTRENMEKAGWKLRGRKESKLAGFQALMLSFEQDVLGTVYVKWGALFGDDEHTISITATVPQEHEKKLSKLVKAAVLSAQPSDEPMTDPAELVPFTLDDSEKLHRVKPSPNRVLIFTRDGQFPKEPNPAEPVFIAVPSIGERLVVDRQGSAELAIRQTQSTKNVDLVSTEPIAIDGLEGYECLADAQDAKSGMPILIYQVMLYDDDSYIRLVGMVGADQRDDYLPEFQALARTLKRKSTATEDEPADEPAADESDQ